MKFLVTGITGFVGPHMAHLLMDEGHDVCGLIRASDGREQNIEKRIGSDYFDKLDFVYGDLTNQESISKIFNENDFDGVFHLAAQSHPPTGFTHPKLTFEVNALGTINIVEAIMKHERECKLMNCSTSEVYGVLKDDTPIDENTQINPVNPYGVSKAGAELYVRERAKSEKCPFVVSRAFSHTGSGRGRNFSISSDAYQLVRVKKGLQKPIIQVGNLKSKRVVMDVRDCVRGYYLLMMKGEPGEAYNIGADPDRLYSMDELFDKMASMLDLKVEKRLDEKLYRPIDIPIQVADVTKFKNLTGWKATIPIEETLQDLLNYWNDNV